MSYRFFGLLALTICLNTVPASAGGRVGVGVQIGIFVSGGTVPAYSARPYYYSPREYYYPLAHGYRPYYYAQRRTRFYGYYGVGPRIHVIPARRGYRSPGPWGLPGMRARR